LQYIYSAQSINQAKAVTCRINH